MATDKGLVAQEKKEFEKAEERTAPGRFFVPSTDIYETGEALFLDMELPGVEKENVDINLDKDVLSIEGRVTLENYDGLDPVYTEYNVGHFARTFRLSKGIDRDGISAEVNDGILRLQLKKAKEAVPRRIEVS